MEAYFEKLIKAGTAMIKSRNLDLVTAVISEFVGALHESELSAKDVLAVGDPLHPYADFCRKHRFSFWEVMPFEIDEINRGSQRAGWGFPKASTQFTGPLYAGLCRF